MVQSISLFQDQQSRPETFVEGSLIATFFKSSNSFYKVLLIKIKKTNLHWSDPKIVVTGDFGDLTSGKDYRFSGHLVHHPKYGEQFKASQCTNETPTSRGGLVKYLAGSDFPGVGPKTAKRVVNALGVNLIEIILSNPQVLKSLHLSSQQFRSIVEGIRVNNGTEQIIIGLNSYGFGSRLASVIFKKYRQNTLQIIQSNPYQLVEDIRGVSFRKADLIAQKMKIAADSDGRLRAGLMTALRQLSTQNGDTYTTVGPLLQKASTLLNQRAEEPISQAKLAKQLIDLAKRHKIIGDGKRVYLASLYSAEVSIAKNLERVQQSDPSHTFSDQKVTQSIRRIEKQLGIDYDRSQVKALKLSMRNQLFLLTGGPGTGKTTIIKGIVSLFAGLNHLSLKLSHYQNTPYPVLLAAPTGRAANQMNQMTGLPASTIHRLLGLTSYNNEGILNSSTNELEGKILIIDEMSMVDTYLFRLLIKSVPTGMKVILVGDKDQLPSVGPGQVFHDLLASDRIAQLGLNTIHRQSANSTIIPLAHAINHGRLPADFTKHKADRSFIACNAGQMGSVIRQIVQLAKMKGFTSTDMQVLAPMYRGDAGIDHLNEIIQQIMNPKLSKYQKEISYHGITYRVGDKVLQLINRPEADIFNGDIGKVTEIDLKSDSGQSKDQIVVDFNDHEVTYRPNQWQQLTLAYCTSIHKAQGSEFKMVILPMVPQYYVMLRRNLLYTAVTRAAQILVLIGDYHSFLYCVKNGSLDRHTTLDLRIRQIMGRSDSNDDLEQQSHQSYILTPKLIDSHTIDPMIGMKGITPDHFMKP